MTVTWKQWRLMDPDTYATVTNPGSTEARKMASVPSDPADSASRNPQGTQHDRIAMNGSLRGLLHHPARGIAASSPLIRGHVFRTHNPTSSTCISFIFGLICILLQLCPMDGGGGGKGCPPGNGGVSLGDPVNLASGAEEYEPPADLTVPNPSGPYITWQRDYGSMRGGGANSAEGNATYECSDFGIGWSQSYNEGVFSPDGGTDASQKYVFMPNGSRIAFTPSAVPSASQPAVACTVQPGAPMTVEWDYDPGSGSNYFTITNVDRSRWITTAITPGNNCYRLAEIQDGLGRGIFFNYGVTDPGYQWPLLTSITTGQGGTGTALLTIQRAADGTNSITSVTDCYGRSVYYNVQAYPDAYDGQQLDHVSQIVTGHASAPPDRYVYGYKILGFGMSRGQVFAYLSTITVPSPSGTGTATAAINYDPNTAFVSSLVDGNGNIRSYTSVDENGNPASNTNYTQVTVTDSSHHLVDTYRASYDNSMSSTGRIDAVGTAVSTIDYASPTAPYKPSSYMDANGHTWSFGYDSGSNCTSITDPRGVTTHLAFDYSTVPTGLPTSVQVGSKQAVSVTVDPTTLAYSSVSVPRPGTVGGTQTSTTGITLDAAGNPTIITTPGSSAGSSYTETLNYTTDGGYTRPEGIHQPVTVTDNNGKVTHYRYDDHNRVSSVIDANGNETDITYNAADQPTVVTFPATGQTGTGQSTAVFTYVFPGGACSHVSVYDESGAMTRDVAFGYDGEGHVTSVSTGGVTASAQYDAQYRPVAVSDGNGNVTQYSYSTAGFLSSVSHPGAGTGSADKVQYTSFDAAGDPLVKIDGRGVETDYTYNDPSSLVTDITYPSSPSSNIHYTYDTYGRIQTETDAVSTRTFAYDDDDDPTSITTTYPGLPSGARTFTVSYTYNPDATRSTMVTPGGTFTYGYDANGRLASVTNPFGETTQWSYADNGWIGSQTLANGVTTGYLRNAAGEMTELVTRKSDSTLLSDFNGMSYDAQGNLLSMTASIPAATSFSGITSYSYDTRDELTQEASARSGGYTNNFAYDSNGNATTFKGTSVSYNSDDQVSGASYDGAGNPASYAGNALSFDAIGNVTSIGTALTAGYLAGGRRAFKTSSSGTTYYLYDGEKPVCEIDGSGNVSAVNTWGRMGLVSRNTSAGSAFYTFDPQGSVCQKLDGTGSPTLSNMFDAYGSPASASTDPYDAPGAQFGNYRDSETGLVWMGHRYYDPTSGRFITRDPLGQGGGSNEYAYAGGNPVRGADPSGLSTLDNWLDEPILGPGSESNRRFLQVTVEAAKSTITNGEYQPPRDIACDRFYGLMRLVTGVVWVDLLVVGSDGLAAPEVLESEGGEVFLAEDTCLCLSGGTAVQMADGSTKPIEQVHTGDYVLARNQQTGQLESKRVSGTISRKAPVLVTLTLSDVRTGHTGTYTSTPDHPFYVAGQGWLTAGTLAKGTAIATRSGMALIVQSVTWHRDEEKGFAVYNMTVEDDHDYLAGTLGGGVWVHNCPINPYDIREYRDFEKYPGDGLAGHEVLQNAWLEQNGHIAERGVGDLSRGNPSLALNATDHNLVNQVQREFGLYDRSVLNNLSAHDIINLNGQAMEWANARGAQIPNSAIDDIVSQAHAYANAWGL